MVELLLPEAKLAAHVCHMQCIVQFSSQDLAESQRWAWHIQNKL